MNESSDALLKQMDDIAGLHAVSWWPLAVGWWAVIGVGLCVMTGLIVWRVRRVSGWRAAAFRHLDDLDRNLSAQTVGATAAALSELLRRIALRDFPRSECAALAGGDWLRWLTSHDPKGFDWAGKGGVLIDAAYAPPGAFSDPAPLRVLLGAARPWIARRRA